MKRFIARRSTGAIQAHRSDIHLADFAIVGKLNYRDDDEPTMALSARLRRFLGSRVWLEHTKVGA